MDVMEVSGMKFEDGMVTVHMLLQIIVLPTPIFLMQYIYFFDFVGAVSTGRKDNRREGVYRGYSKTSKMFTKSFLRRHVSSERISS